MLLLLYHTPVIAFNSKANHVVSQLQEIHFYTQGKIDLGT